MLTRLLNRLPSLQTGTRRTIASPPANRPAIPPAPQTAPGIPQSPLGQQGTSRGIRIAPGSNDDGWIVPPPVSLKDGSTVRLFKDGEALKAAYDAIKSAKRRICLEVYIFHSDPTGWAFADALCERARAGVSVYLIYDSFGSVNTDPALFQKLKHAGVNLQEFHPIRPWDCTFRWRPFNRDHRKLLIIDDHIAGMGGLNVGAEYAGSWVVHCDEGDCDFWRDNAIGIVGPSAQWLVQCFRHTWYYCTHGGRLSTAEYYHELPPPKPSPRSNFRAHGLSLPRPDELGEISAIASVPSPRSSRVTQMLYQRVRQALHSIRLTMAYFAPADELIEELCSAARRGVLVQLMLPERCDIKLLHIAAQSFYERLLLAGVEIYERQGAILHAKTLVIDDSLSILGSTNMDYRSIEYNLELSCAIRSIPFGRQMSDLFANDMNFSRRIHLSEWRHRPARDRLVQWAVSRARYLL